MIYRSPPEDFRVVFEAVLCLVVCRGDILLLLRKEGTALGGMWGLPGGSVRQGELPGRALRRELFEETGYRIRGRMSALPRYIEKVWAPREPPSEGLSYRPAGLFYVYGLELAEKFVVIVNPEEHRGFSWVNLRGGFASMKTVPDLEGFVRLAYPDL